MKGEIRPLEELVYEMADVIEVFSGNYRKRRSVHVGGGRIVMNTEDRERVNRLDQLVLDARTSLASLEGAE